MVPARLYPRARGAAQPGHAPADVEQSERHAQLYRLVEQLPADQRRVIEMRFAEEKSIREIATEVGGEQAGQMFEMAEMQINIMLQTDIRGLLSSLGDRHSVLTFPAAQVGVCDRGRLRRDARW